MRLAALQQQVAHGWLQEGSIRAPIGGNDLGDVGVCSYIFKVCYCFFGVYIIPKWLINDS